MLDALIRPTNTAAQLQKIDKQVFWILLAQFPVTAFFMPIGKSGDHWFFALAASAAIAVAAIATYVLARGTRQCGFIFGALFMMTSVVMIMVSAQTENHFSIFVYLALLIAYRDALLIWVAAALIALHHVVFNVLQAWGAQWWGLPVVVFDTGPSWGMVFHHAAFVVFEVAILTWFALGMSEDRRRANRLKGIINQFRHSMDLTQRLPEHSEADREFNGMFSSFEQAIALFRELSLELSQSSEKLTQAFGRIESGTREQIQEIEEGSAATAQMVAAIHQVSAATHETSDSMNTLTENVGTTKRCVETANQRLITMHEALEQGGRDLKHLTQEVGNITQFIDGIADISDQTNLLALNAAIEAARAGESGRGFAVVADEVRNLSRRTHEFTDQIRGTIEKLQRASLNTQEGISRGVATASESSEKMADATQAIAGITEEVQDLAAMNTQIAASVDQQAEAARQIDDNFRCIVERARDIAAIGAQVGEAAMDLKELIGQISKETERYTFSAS